MDAKSEGSQRRLAGGYSSDVYMVIGLASFVCGWSLTTRCLPHPSHPRGHQGHIRGHRSVTPLTIMCHGGGGYSWGRWPFCSPLCIGGFLPALVQQ
ncbi:hypothetical protein FKM82_016506 [Ascaphus truei]